jgi:hypothetical protein
MGYELRRQLREALGPSVTGLQRAVALEIADDANEHTRMSVASLDELVRWTGAKDGVVIRNALKRLAAAGWEFRIPIGRGKDGRTLYAVPGRRMTFKVPEFEGVAVATPKGEQGLPQGVAGAHSEEAPAHSEGAGATPSSSDSSSPQEEEAASAQGGATATPLPEISDEAKRKFLHFWTHYPKSRNKDESYAAWKAAIASGADPDAIISAAVAYAREKNGEPWRFIKYSANWLTERRYEDDYEPEPNGKPNLRAVAGGHTPHQLPEDHSVYQNGF